MNAVGADHDIGLDGAAVGKARRGGTRAAFDADAAGAEAQFVVLSAAPKTSSKSARCTDRFGAPNFWRKSPRLVREI